MILDFYEKQLKVDLRRLSLVIACDQSNRCIRVHVYYFVYKKEDFVKEKQLFVYMKVTNQK